MWLFTPFGFYSVVRKTPGPQLTIRGRTRGDLVRLRARYLPTATEPQAHGGTDYPWRMRCDDQALAAAMPQIVLDITYANFKDAVAQELGSARAHRYHTVWHALYGMPEDAPVSASQPASEPSADAPLPWDTTPPRGMKLAYGGVVMDTTGRVLLREVAGQYAGYVWSFAKGRPDPGESPREAALREVHEEMGVRPRIVCPIPEAFDGQVTRSHFFLMEAHADAVDTGFRSNETASVRWADRQEAARLLALTHDATGRARDLGVLAAALAVWEGRAVSPEGGGR